MASYFASSDIEGSPTSHASLTSLSWWSDSDSLRSHRRSASEDSPWWESDNDDKKQWSVSCEESRKGSPIPSPVFGGNTCISSPSSVTPTWWSEPSSRHLSTSGTEVEKIPLENQQIREGGQQSGTNDEEMASMPKKNRKRLREQSTFLGDDAKEPPTNRLKPTPLSPLANNAKKGISEPLQIFLLFFTVDVLEKICDLTNTHAWEVVLFNQAFASDDGGWEDITVKEMQIFIAIILIMKRNPDVGFGCFFREQRVGQHWPRTLMKRSRFFAIVQLLTIADPRNSKKTSHVQDSTSPEAKKFTQHKSQSGRIIEKSEYFLYFFNQIKTVLKTFQPSFNIQFAEKIISRKVSTEQDEISNYMKVVPSTCEPSDQTRKQSSTLIDSKLVPDLKSNILKSSEVVIQVNSTRPSNGFVSINRQESSKEDSKALAELPNNRPRILEESPVISDNSINDLSTDLNVISLKWHDGTFKITVDVDCSENSTCDIFLGDVAVEDAPDLGHWQRVFLPCPEVIYIDAMSTKDDPDCAQNSERPSNPPLAKSFFYHYLNLAHFFSTTKAFPCPASAFSTQASELLNTDLGNQIIDGLVSQGDAGLLSQSDSDSEMRESDVTCDTSSEAVGSESGDESDGGGQKLHKYVQARSRIGQKCALCWSHREVRKVHTRCAQCGRHFCLSRFRNCMDEAHNDLEAMQQVLDEESS